MSTGGTDPPFRLSMSQVMVAGLRRLFHRAIVVGARDRFARSMTEIETALQHVPKSWGQAVTTSEALRLTRYQRLYDQLAVQYVVHLDHPMVWLTSVEPTRRSPLWIGQG